MEADFMSKILLIDSSPRRMGNSSLITEMLAEDLSGNEASGGLLTSSAGSHLVIPDPG